MNMMRNYNPKEYRRDDNMKGIKTIMLLLALIATLIFNTGTASAAIDGITKDNYADYVKPIADEYGYNVGECEKEYLNGEEWFYNDHIDHWNVDKVYSKDLIPADWNKVTEVTTKATTTTTKKTVVKKAKKTKKAKTKKKNKKKNKKSKKSK